MWQANVGRDAQMIPAQRYKLEFILHTYNASLQMIKNSLAEFGESLEIVESQDSAQNGDNYNIRMKTEDPTIVFDLCAQFGRIRSIKVTEEKGVA